MPASLHRRTVVAARRLLVLAAVLAACRPARSTTPPVAPPATPSASELRRTYDLPRTDGAWTAADVVETRAVFVRLERERPDLLPTHDGPDAALLARLAALTDIAATASLDDLRALHQASADILQIYSVRALARGERGREYVDLAAAFFALSALRLDREQFTAESVRADPARLDAFVQQRFHLARGVHDVLASALALPTVIDPRHATTTLAPIAGAVAPWFLPEERDRVLDLADRLAAAGAADDPLAALRLAFAPDREPDPRVDAVVDAHREHSDAQEELLARVGAGAVVPVDLGRDGEWTRWGFPDAGFSAAFPQRPNAQKHDYVASDGVPMTTRMLAIKDPGRVSRLVTCTTRARPLAGRTGDDELRSVAATLKLQGLRTITVDGAAGLEGTATTDSTQALVRLVEVDSTGCSVVFEAPQELARELADEQRRFVDSFRLGSLRPAR